jgi:hypothetical protein
MQKDALLIRRDMAILERPDWLRFVGHSLTRHSAALRRKAGVGPARLSSVYCASPGVSHSPWRRGRHCSGSMLVRAQVHVGLVGAYEASSVILGHIEGL